MSRSNDLSTFVCPDIYFMALGLRGHCWLAEGETRLFAFAFGRVPGDFTASCDAKVKLQTVIIHHTLTNERSTFVVAQSSRALGVNLNSSRSYDPEEQCLLSAHV